MRTTLRTAAALLGALMLAASGPMVASASPANETPPVSLEAIQASAETLIAGRLGALTEVVSAAESSTYLTDGHRATIVATASAASSGLDSLRSTIASDDSRASAAAHWVQIFTAYRVYAVVVPQSAYAAAADGLTEGALPALEKTYTALEAALAVSPKSTPELEAQLVTMRTQLDAAARDTVGVADVVLAVTPAQWNADPAVFADERAALAAASLAAAAAADAAATIIEALQ